MDSQAESKSRNCHRSPDGVMEIWGVGLSALVSDALRMVHAVAQKSDFFSDWLQRDRFTILLKCEAARAIF